MLLMLWKCVYTFPQYGVGCVMSLQHYVAQQYLCVYNTLHHHACGHILYHHTLWYRMVAYSIRIWPHNHAAAATITHMHACV